MISILDVTGYVAATLTTCAFVPQMWRSVRTRDMQGISLWMYLMLTTGIALWLAYGVMTHAGPVIWANGISLLFAVVVLGMKLASLRRVLR